MIATTVLIYPKQSSPGEDVWPGTNPLREQALTISTQALKFKYQH